MAKIIKVLFAFVLLALFVIGISVTGWGTYLSLTQEHLQPFALKGLLLAALPVGFMFMVSPSWKRRA